MITYIIRLLLSYIIEDKTPDPEVGEYWVFNEDQNNPFDEYPPVNIVDIKNGYVQYGLYYSMSIRKFKCMYKRSSR